MSKQDCLLLFYGFVFNEIPDRLTRFGADTISYVRGHETPLIAAVRDSNITLARFLVMHRADVNLAVDAPTARGVERRSPLSEAVKRGDGSMERLLRSYGAR